MFFICAVVWMNDEIIKVILLCQHNKKFSSSFFQPEKTLNLKKILSTDNILCKYNLKKEARLCAFAQKVPTPLIQIFGINVYQMRNSFFSQNLSEQKKSPATQIIECCKKSHIRLMRSTIIKKTSEDEHKIKQQ